MLTDVIARFLQSHAIDRLLVAISGGPDSTALLVALAELRVPVVAAHVNHHLRGTESDDDERYVRELCELLRVQLGVLDGTLDPDAIRHRGIEAAAREVRHARLHALRETLGLRWIATAHQRDDQAETVLMRLMTGSGLAGLRGIHPLRDDGVVRPMLEVTRAEVEEFLRERNIVARTDSSNADPRFLRNRVRAMLRELPPYVSRNLAAIADEAHIKWAVVEQALDQIPVEATESESRFLSWPKDPWLKHALLHRHIRRLDPNARLTSGTTSTKNLELVGNVLRRRQARASVFHWNIEIRAGESKFIEPINTTISITAQPRNRATAQPFQLPTGSTPTFTVRNRRNGDRFRPLGMSRDKKLKDFLIDRKIPVAVRDRIPLLIWNGQIVWVGGVEISDAFKVTDPAGGEQFEVWLERAGASVEAAEGQASLHS